MRLPRTMTPASHNGLTQIRVESVMEAYKGDSLGRFLITRDEETGDPQGGAIPTSSKNGKPSPL